MVARPTAALSKSSMTNQVFAAMRRREIVCMLLTGSDCGVAQKGPARQTQVFLLPDQIKRDKGVWWMPWQQEAMKDVILCDKPWGAENKL